MTLDELLLEWSYRSERGYPTLDSPSDVSILKEILTKLNLSEEDVSSIIDELEDDDDGVVRGDEDGNNDIDGLDGSGSDLPGKPKIPSISTDDEEDKEEKPEDKPEKIPTAGDTTYDAIIRNHLGLKDDQPIPRVENTYPWPGRGGSTFNIQVKGNDLKYWKDFWELAPPVKGKEIGTKSKGTGNGEVALYWLYQHSNSASVKGTQGADNPDLEFDGVGVEVKAFGKAHEKAKGLGRWSQDKDQLDALGILFGFQKLVSTLQPKSSGKLPPDISPNNFKGYQLKDAFEQLAKLKEINLERLGKEYPIFLDIKARLESLSAKIGDWDPENPEDAARRMAVYFISPKVGRKPGDGGFLTHVLENGDCRFWAFDIEKLKNHPDLIAKKGQSGYIGSASSQMYVEFDHLLG